MYLFFDTETTGLPLNWAAPVENYNNWPRMVQAAWIIHDDDGAEISSKNYIIKPEGFGIPEEAARIHGITTQIAIEKGANLDKVLREFGNEAAKSNFLVGHNINFDEKIMGAEFLRRGMKNRLAGKTTICTMKAATEYCGIVNRYGYKWPKLSELHQQLFGIGFAAAHNAAADIEITAKCFWELKRRGIL
jgi:DNA polymerase III subunit epsilon